MTKIETLPDTIQKTDALTEEGAKRRTFLLAGGTSLSVAALAPAAARCWRVQPVTRKEFRRGKASHCRCRRTGWPIT